MEKSTFKEYEIPMSGEVAAELRRVCTTSLFSKEHLKLIWSTVPLGAATFSFILVVLWLLVDWLIGLIVPINFGWNSQYGNYIFWSIIGFSYLYFFVEVAKSCGPSSETRKALKNDLAGRVVKVSEYSINEVKVFEEPEHGGFIYFVRTSDEKIMALFDAESQDLSVSGEDPKNSSYKVRKVLKISRAPNANFIIDEDFSGDIVQMPELKLFTDNTKIWPKHADLVKCKWENIDEKYDAKKRKL